VKFVYLFAKSLEIPIITNESNLTVLNMGYKHDLVQLKQDVSWHLTYSRSVTYIAWKIPLDVMKFVYFHKTYVLSLLIIGLNITCTKLWVLWICPRPTSYLYLSQLKTWLALNDEIRVKLIKIWVHSLGQFGMKKSPVRKGCVYDTLQPGQVLISSHFRHQAPPYTQTRHRT